MSTIDPPYFTYWSHPESDSVFAEHKHVSESSKFNAFELNELSFREFIPLVKSRSQLPTEITAVIKDAYRAPGFKDPSTFIIKGKIFFDKTERFEDGTKVSTSFVRDLRSDGICLTRDSVYLIEFADQAPKKLPNGNPESDEEQPNVS